MTEIEEIDLRERIIYNVIQYRRPIDTINSVLADAAAIEEYIKNGIPSSA